MRSAIFQFISLLISLVSKAPQTSAFPPFVLRAATSSLSPLLPLPRFRPQSSLFRLYQTPLQAQESQYIARAATAAPMQKLEIVYIIMYNAGTTEEAVHTVSSDGSSDNEVLLAFASLDESVTFADAIRRAGNTSAEPVPTPAPLAQMELACREMGLVLQVVPEP